VLPISRQVFSHFQESRASSRRMVTWEDKQHNSQCSPFPISSLKAVTAEHDIVWHGISLGSVGVSCPGCVPSQLLVHPKLMHSRAA